MHSHTKIHLKPNPLEIISEEKAFVSFRAGTNDLISKL